MSIHLHLSNNDFYSPVFSFELVSVKVQDSRHILYFSSFMSFAAKYIVNCFDNSLQEDHYFWAPVLGKVFGRWTAQDGPHGVTREAFAGPCFSPPPPPPPPFSPLPPPPPSLPPSPSPSLTSIGTGETKSKEVSNLVFLR